MKGWVQVDAINKKYVPVIDMKSDKLKGNKTEIEFAVQKLQHGPIQYEMKPRVGMLIDKYLPQSFLEDVVNVQMTMLHKGKHYSQTCTCGRRK
eukprot:1344998-Ditylum_brightwellii.AAC.1